jgi:gluconokinase
MSPLVKLRWYSEEARDVAARVRRWVGAKERVVHRLTGEWVVDHGVASATGLFNLGDEDWDAEALAWARVSRDRLSPLVPTTTVLRVSADGARAAGLPDGCPLVVGAADGPLANLGLGAIRRGAVACSIGTSGALRVAADTPQVDARGRVFCYVLAPGRWIIGGATNNGGSVLDWSRAALAPDIAQARGDEAVPALLALAGQAAPGSRGLLFVPHLLGERAPRWSEGARGAYLGLTRTHGRAELVRAQLEGVCLQLALVLTSLGEAGADVHEIRATGGFSRSPLWRRILAGVFGRPVGFAHSPEGSGLGAALLGMYALGVIEDLDHAADVVRIESVERPHEDESEIYARVLEVYRRAVEDVAATSEALTALQELLPDRPGPASPDRRRPPPR